MKVHISETNLKNEWSKSQSTTFALQLSTFMVFFNNSTKSAIKKLSAFHNILHNDMSNQLTIKFVLTTYVPYFLNTQ